MTDPMLILSSLSSPPASSVAYGILKICFRYQCSIQGRNMGHGAHGSIKSFQRIAELFNNDVLL